MLVINRTEIPPEAVNVTQQPLYSTDFFVDDRGVLQRKTKKVLLLSTRHQIGHISSDNWKKKPNTVLFYNDTKCGVDCLDQMCKLYTEKSGVRRWPLAIFFNLLDLAAINAHVLYYQVLVKQMSRRKFLQLLIQLLARCENEITSPEP